LWWYTTGPFSFLPIHAAGIYDNENSERVSDYAVSSYTPILHVLLTPVSPATVTFQMLAIIQPETPGYIPLPFTHNELLKIAEHVSEKHLVKLGILKAPATLENVISHLLTASIVHIACHGEQDTENPLESALILDGGQRLNVSQIMKQKMPNASLAFLSACQTAMGDETLSDEAIHLAASLLFAGFHGVVATMW
jgi:CHAT domain-containing protein